MSKYQVTYYYHTSCTVEVEADSPEEAVEAGYNVEAGSQLLYNLQEDDDPEVEEV